MKYSLIDTHCDTLGRVFDEKSSLFGNSFHVDLKRCNYKEYTQFFAAFIDPLYKGRECERARDLIGCLKSEIAKNSEKIAFCKSYDDYLQNKGKIRAFLSLEGGESITDLDALYKFYNEGVRLIALTWNYSNHIAGGTLDDENKGLTLFGKKVIGEMNRLGIIPDVSHLNDKSFWDVIEESKKPVIASHSNSRKICKNPRNLTDEQFLAIKNKGGFVGINLYPPFLCEGIDAGISDIIAHIEHFLSLGGEDNIGIGADMDGVDKLPRDFSGYWDVCKIFEELLRLGVREDVVNKISHTNMERILQENL